MQNPFIIATLLGLTSQVTSQPIPLPGAAGLGDPLMGMSGGAGLVPELKPAGVMAPGGAHGGAGGATGKAGQSPAAQDMKKSLGEKPLLGENDRRCYSSRFTDLKGADPLEHYATVGQGQGRLGTCARTLTDFEAQQYVNSFPDLQAKYGRKGEKALAGARAHYTTMGYASAHYNEPMKDVEKRAWQCGPAPNTECKCHGTLWFGAAKRPDNKADVKTWEEMRFFKHVSKQKAGFALCNSKEFGTDPLPGIPKQCFCEDEPPYEPNLCADDGDDCVCGGYVLYGQKFSESTKKQNTFAGLVDSPFAIAAVTEGTNSLSCTQQAFGGADPFPEGEKMCYCDQEKKFFDAGQVSSLQEFWAAEFAERQFEGELLGAKTVQEDLEKEVVTKTEEWTQEIEVEEAEKKATMQAVEACKGCTTKASEASKKFTEETLRRQSLQEQRVIEVERQRIAQSRGKTEIKQTAASEACALAQRSHDPTQKQRLLEECSRLKSEVMEERTQTDAQETQVEERERTSKSKTSKETRELEAKSEAAEATERAADETKKNELESKSSETKAAVLSQKAELEEKKLEILKLEEKTQTEINKALQKKREAVLVLIQQEKQKMNQLNRQEETVVDEDDDAASKTAVSDKVTASAEARTTKATKLAADYAAKVTYANDQVTTITEKLTPIRAKVTDLKGTLDHKNQEVAELAKSLKTKQEHLEQNPTSTTTVKEIEAIKSQITEDEVLIKTTRKEYVQATAEATSFGKLTEFYGQEKRQFETTIRVQEEELEDAKQVIKEQTEKQAIGSAVGHVIEDQKVAFETHQQVVEVEEKINEVKKVAEEKVVELTNQKLVEEKKLAEEKGVLAKVTNQQKVLQETLKTTKDPKEITRLTKEVEAATAKVTTVTTYVTKIEGGVTKATEAITTATTESTTYVTTMTASLHTLEEKSKTDDEKASKSVNELPGQPGEKPPAPSVTPSTAPPSTRSRSPSGGAGGSGGYGGSGGVGGIPGMPGGMGGGGHGPSGGSHPSPGGIGGGPSSSSAPSPTIPAGPAPTAPGAAPRDKFTTTSITGGKMTIPVGQAPVLPKDPTPGVGNVGEEVASKTEEAKTRRVECTRATERLAQQKELIGKQTAELKNDIGTQKAALDTCAITVGAHQNEIRKAQQDLMNPAVTQKVGMKEQLANKVRTLEAQLEAETRNCQQAQLDVEQMERTIADKKAEVKELRRFVNQGCAEAMQAEQEVTEIITMITQVEVTRRQYNYWVTTTSSVAQQEKVYGQNKLIYDRERKRLLVLVEEHHKRSETASATLIALNKKLEELSALPNPTTEITTQIAKVKVLIPQTTKIVAETEAGEAKEKAACTKLDTAFQVVVTTTTTMRRDARRAQNQYEDAQKQLQNRVNANAKVQEYRQKLVLDNKTLTQKVETITHIVGEIKHELEVLRSKTSVITLQITESTRKVTQAKESVTVLTTTLQSIETAMKTTKDPAEKKGLAKQKTDSTASLETSKNVVGVEEGTLSKLREELTEMGSVQVSYEKEYRYYTEILVKVQQDLKDAKITTSTVIYQGKVIPELEEPEDEDGADGEPKKDEKKEDKKEEKKDAKKDEKKEEKKGDKKEEKKDGKKGDDKGDDKKKEEPKKATGAGGGSHKKPGATTTTEVEEIESQKTMTDTKIAELEASMETIDTKSTKIQESLATVAMQVTLEEGQKDETSRDIQITQRRLERQRCAVAFPQVFNQYSKQKALSQAGMCPCQGSATGVSQIAVQVQHPEEADSTIQSLFAQKLVIEATFSMQVQRTSLNNENKVVQEGEKELFTLTLVTSDEKVTAVLTALEEGGTQDRGEAVVSPLLTGRKAYMEWVQNSLSSSQQGGLTKYSVPIDLDVTPAV